MSDRLVTAVIDEHGAHLAYLVFNLERSARYDRWIRRHIQLSPDDETIYRVIGVQMPGGKMTLRVIQEPNPDPTESVYIGLPIQPPPTTENGHPHDQQRTAASTSDQASE